MASIRCTDVQARPSAFLDLTSVTLEVVYGNSADNSHYPKTG
jgi:hypothetical protein